MEHTKIKRNVKDSVFSALFREPKYLRELCKVLKPDVTEAELDSIKDVTIQNVLTNGMYNDLALVIGDVIFYLLEAQSTWSYNMPFRVTAYAVEKLREYVIKNKCNLFGRKAVRLPVPKFYMIYTGAEEHSEERLTLKETAFGGVESSLEATVEVIKLSSENNILDQYIKFTKISDEQVKLHGRNRETMAKIIDICVKSNILSEFLIDREAEVIDIMDALFNEEFAMEAMLKDERAEGRAEGRLDMIRNLMQSLSITAEKALETLRIPSNEWKDYLPQLS